MRSVGSSILLAEIAKACVRRVGAMRCCCLWVRGSCSSGFIFCVQREHTQREYTQLHDSVWAPHFPQQLPVLSYSLAWNMGAITSIMACMHTSRSLEGRMLRQKGHLKSATAAVVEIPAPLWTNLSQKLRSSAGPRRRCEHRRVHSGQSRRWQQPALWSTALLQPYISHRVSTLCGHS